MITLRSRLFLNNSPASLSAITCERERDVYYCDHVRTENNGRQKALEHLLISSHAMREVPRAIAML